METKKNAPLEVKASERGKERTSEKETERENRLPEIGQEQTTSTASATQRTVESLSSPLSLASNTRRSDARRDSARLALACYPRMHRVAKPAERSPRIPNEG